MKSFIVQATPFAIWSRERSCCSPRSKFCATSCWSAIDDVLVVAGRHVRAARIADHRTERRAALLALPPAPDPPALLQEAFAEVVRRLRELLVVVLGSLPE